MFSHPSKPFQWIPPLSRRPPLSGLDDLAYLNQPYRLNGVIEANDIPDSNFSVSWSVVRGNARVMSPDSLSTEAIISEYGTVQFRLTVSYGTYEVYDDIVLTVNTTNQFYRILRPHKGDVYYPGDTLFIQWESINTEDAVLAISYDNGRTWETIGDGTVYPGDEYWENYPSIVPGDAQITAQAKISISAYFGETRSISEAFEIRVR